MPHRDTGLTASPRADTASPAANTLRAAFTSRSWHEPHSGHVHCRTCSGSFGIVYPHSEQRLDDGNHLSIPTNSRPCQSALYSNCRRNSDQLASAMDLDRQRFCRMFETDRLSTAITWFSLTSRVDSLCRKSLRASAIFACRRATLVLAFLRRFEPLVFLASRRCADLVQPGVLGLLFQRRQRRRRFVVAHPFLPLHPGIRAQAKHVVVGKARAAERAGKSQFLLGRRVKPESVGALDIHSHGA